MNTTVILGIALGPAMDCFAVAIGSSVALRGASLVVLSLATSVDALAVGFSFVMLGVTVWFPSVVVGVVSATVTAVGMQIGSRMEILGGLVLIAIGVKILLEHLG